MGNCDLSPVSDWRNDGWGVTGSGVTKLYECWNNTDDTKYCKSPASKGYGACTFPVDITAVPDGAVITSVTVIVRAARVGSTRRSFTSHVSCTDDTSRYTSRTCYPTTTPTDIEVCTYTRDPLGFPWDIQRINKLICRFFSYEGVLDCIRIYKVIVRVTYRVRPTVAITAPTGTVTTPTPTVSWTYTQTDGDPQKQADYRIFTSVDATKVGFNPDRASAVYATTVSGDISSVTLPTSLDPDSYYVYVRARSSFNAQSLWDRRAFTVRGPAPSPPGDDNADVSAGVGTVTVVPDSYSSSAVLRLRDSSNLLSVQAADFETTTDSNGYSTTNCAIVRDTTTLYSDGLASLKLTASSAATMAAVGNFTEVAENTPVTVRCQFRAASSGRTVNVKVEYLAASYATVGSTLTGTGSDLSSTWTEVTATGTTPAGTAFAKVTLEVVSPANAEVHYIDRVGLMYGTNSAWSSGGLMSRNLLTAHLATGDDPVSGPTWVTNNTATSVAQATASGTGAHGAKCYRMTYNGASPSIGFRATGTVFTSATSGTTLTLNKPAGVVDGDFLVAYITCTGTNTLGTVPAGWTLANAAGSTTATNETMFVLKKNGLTSDPSTWTDGALGAATTRRSAVVVAYSGAADVTGNFLAENVKVDNSGSTASTTATVNNTVANSWRLSAFAWRDDVTGGTSIANIVPPTASAITFVGAATPWSSSSSGTSYTINKPANVAQYDVMIATVCVASTATSTASETVTPPTGWTLIRKMSIASSTRLLFATMYRVAGASEPSSWAGTLSSSFNGTDPYVTEAVAYRNVDTTTPILAENGTTGTTQTISTPTITNTNSGAWRITAFGAATPSGYGWTSTEVIERSDFPRQGGAYYSSYFSTSSIRDSNASVSTGSHSRSGTNGASVYGSAAWIGLLKPASSAPASGSNETERLDNTNGSATPWQTLSVYDSNGIAASGIQSVTGVFTPGSGSAIDCALSWIGILQPAAPTTQGYAAAKMSSLVELENLDPRVLGYASSKVTVTSHFLGSTGGTPYLQLDCYRANQLLLSQIKTGSSFDASTWTRTSGTFDIPDGTTRLGVVLSAADRAVASTVDFDRVSVALGDSRTWRNGTGRSEHPVWSIPSIQFAEDDGAGYGEWADLGGLASSPPVFDPLSGSLSFVDHTITPLINRKYRVRTIAYGLAGDMFVSGYGPESAEIAFPGTYWWLKDIQNPGNNMQIRVKADPVQVGTTNTSAVFQPLGEDLPIVLTEGYKGDAFGITIICTMSEYASLRRLLRSGRTLFLQSNMDNAWWVRPIGDLDSETLVTSQRGVNPLRFVKVTFTQVAPEA